MWRIAGAMLVAVALSAAAAAKDQVSDGRPVRVAEGGTARASSSIVGHRVAAIAAQQAGTLRRELRRCEPLRARQARTRCEQMALAHVAAGAKLNAIILRAGGPSAAGSECARLAARLAGLAGTLAFLGVEAGRSTPWPDQVSADARAALRVAGRIRRVARPGACTPGMDGPRV
jgi:hypothetical protein